MRSPVVIDAMTRQVEQEEKARAADWNEKNRERILALHEFTNGRPVTIVRLENGGAIVANNRGREMFARPDGLTVQVGEKRWLSPGEAGPMIGGFAE